MPRPRMDRATLSSHAVTRLYREMLRAVRQLPEADRSGALQEVRIGFRKHAHEKSQKEIDGLLKIAQGRLGYIKIVTPRRPENQAGVKRFIVKDGSVAEGSDGLARAGLVQHAGIYPDDIARHKYLIERQHFMHRKK